MKYNVPQFEEIKVATAGSVIVGRTPVDGTLTFVHKMNGDGTLGTKYVIGDSASGTTATLSEKTITFAEGEALVGDRFFVSYEYEASDVAGQGATRVTADAVNFPTAGKFVMEVLGNDLCDPSTLYSAYIIFPNAKLMSDFELNFTTEGKHPFSMRAMQDYCDPDKVLFRIVVPEMRISSP